MLIIARGPALVGRSSDCRAGRSRGLVGAADQSGDPPAATAIFWIGSELRRTCDSDGRVGDWRRDHVPHFCRLVGDATAVIPPFCAERVAPLVHS